MRASTGPLAGVKVLELGTLIAGPQYRAPMMSECVRVMLPDALQKEIFSDRPAGEPHKPGD